MIESLEDYLADGIALNVNLILEAAMTVELSPMTRLNDKSNFGPSFIQPLHDKLQSIHFFDVKMQQYQAKNVLSQRANVARVCSIKRESEQLAALDIV